jgi:hypothetical protein
MDTEAAAVTAKPRRGRRGRRARRVVLYLALGAVILLAGVWAMLGWRLPLPLTRYTMGSVYVGEVIAFTAFGIAWLAAGKDLSIAKAVAKMVAHPIKAVARNG